MIPVASPFHRRTAKELQEETQAAAQARQQAMARTEEARKAAMEAEERLESERTQEEKCEDCEEPSLNPPALVHAVLATARSETCTLIELLRFARSHRRRRRRRRLLNEEKDMRAKALAAQLAIDMAEAQRLEAAERAEKCGSVALLACPACVSASCTVSMSKSFSVLSPRLMEVNE